jgi:hypothetical protein
MYKTLVRIKLDDGSELLFTANSAQLESWIKRNNIVSKFAPKPSNPSHEQPSKMLMEVPH